MAKQRWWGREILELVSTEFRDRSIEYYVRKSFRQGLSLCLIRPSAMLSSQESAVSMESLQNLERSFRMGIG